MYAHIHITIMYIYADVHISGIRYGHGVFTPGIVGPTGLKNHVWSRVNHMKHQASSIHHEFQCEIAISEEVFCRFSDTAIYGYGSIPINTIFRGMNIHLPAILMFTRGTRFWHTAISYQVGDQVPFDPMKGPQLRSPECYCDNTIQPVLAGLWQPGFLTLFQCSILHPLLLVIPPLFTTMHTIAHHWPWWITNWNYCPLLSLWKPWKTHHRVVFTIHY